jgi:uncharacterized protein DUF3883
MTDRTAWALPSGVPSLHIARAALHAAAIVDTGGSPTADARESYWHHATGGSFPPPDLRRGERLLVDCGLLIEHAGSLMPTRALEAILAGSVEDALATLCQHALEITRPATARIAVDLKGPAPEAETTAAIAALVPDAERREELLLALAQRFDDTHRRLVGEIGEDLVVDAARAELRQLGHAELARSVRRVSLTSDQLGYDVAAPRVGGPSRLLEVKTTTAAQLGAALDIRVSRNEADTGQQLADWALVICAIDDLERRQGQIVGWCPHDAIADALPHDTTTGRWEQARLQLADTALMRGLPSAIA